MRPWASYLASLGLLFIMCKIDYNRTSLSLRCCENKWKSSMDTIKRGIQCKVSALWKMAMPNFCWLAYRSSAYAGVWGSSLQTFLQHKSPGSRTEEGWRSIVPEEREPAPLTGFTALQLCGHSHIALPFWLSVVSSREDKTERILFHDIEAIEFCVPFQLFPSPTSGRGSECFWLFNAKW